MCHKLDSGFHYLLQVILKKCLAMWGTKDAEIQKDEWIILVCLPELRKEKENTT